MDRELLIEIGCEEIPASWLPGLTAQMAPHLDARLKEFRLTPASPAESYSTPRRLTARVAKLAERQTDFEELVTGPPVSAAFKPDGSRRPPRPALPGNTASRSTALERQRDAEGHLPRLSRAAARQGHGRRARRRHGRPAARPDVPEADALGRLPRGRQGRAGLRAPDSLAGADVRRPRRAVRHPPHGAGAGPERPGHPVGLATPTAIAF